MISMKNRETKISMKNKETHKAESSGGEPLTATSFFFLLSLTLTPRVGHSQMQNWTGLGFVFWEATGE